MLCVLFSKASAVKYWQHIVSTYCIYFPTNQYPIFMKSTTLTNEMVSWLGAAQQEVHVSEREPGCVRSRSQLT